MQSTTISVPEVHCQHCISSIEGTLQPRDGIASAAVDLDRKVVDVAWDAEAIELDAIVAAIEEQGYEVAGTS
jgi:copper chaperone